MTDRSRPPTGDRERWDAKHESARGQAPGAPDPFVQKTLDGLSLEDGLRALDLASGTGRHALDLARRGFSVAAWDVSPVGLAVLEERAAAAGRVITTRVVNLVEDGVGDTSETFDLVVLANFLDRPLNRQLARLVRPGGHLVLIAFTLDRPGDHPSARFCLDPGELAQGIPGLETLHHEERAGRAGLCARRPAHEIREPTVGSEDRAG